MSGNMGMGSMSGALRFDVKNLFDASKILPCVVEAVVGTQGSSEAFGTFWSNIPYISCVLIIALSNIVVL